MLNNGNFLNLHWAGKQMNFKRTKTNKRQSFSRILIVTIFSFNQIMAQTTGGPDDNLFPIIITNPTTPTLPSGPTDPILPIDPGIPGLPTDPGISPILPTNPGISPLPGGGSLLPGIGGIGGIGGGIGGIGGIGNNTQIQTAQVPNEFYCPLFESNPYESIFRAMDAMNQAMRTNNECQQQVGNQYSDFYSDSEKIRNMILQIQQYSQNPDYITTANTREIERVVTDAVSGINSIATNLSSNKFFNKNCASSKSSLAKAALSLNDILNNLAPVALVIASLNPGIGVATKLALLGGVYATTAVKGFQQFMDSNTLDLTNPEVRKAILQNTCQFVKVRQKIDFLQLGEEGRLGEIKTSLFKNIEAYRSRYNNPSSQLLPLMQYKYQTEKVITDIEAKLVEDKYNTNFYFAKLKAAGEDKERICLMGSSLVKRSKDAETYPSSALRILESAVDSTKLSGQVDAQVQTESEEFYTAFTKSRNRLSILSAKALADDSADTEKAISMCAEETKLWLKRIADTITYSDDLINKEAKEIEQVLSQNTEFQNWNAQYKKLKSERTSLNRVVKVLKEMARPDAVYIRSELDQRSQELKATLFRTQYFWTKSPVMAWLDNNIEMHQRSISRFKDFVKLLQQGSFTMTTTGMGKTDKKPYYAQDKQIIEDLNTMSRLENLNSKTLPLGSREHEIACQQMRDAYLKFKASKDYLGAAQFMCDMIDPFINDTSDSIISTCRGGKTFNSPKKSEIVVSLEKLKFKSHPKAISLEEYASIINQKRTSLKCPLPSVDAID